MKQKRTNSVLFIGPAKVHFSHFQDYYSFSMAQLVSAGFVMKLYVQFNISNFHPHEWICIIIALRTKLFRIFCRFDSRQIHDFVNALYFLVQILKQKRAGPPHLSVGPSQDTRKSILASAQYSNAPRLYQAMNQTLCCEYCFSSFYNVSFNYII